MDSNGSGGWDWRNGVAHLVFFVIAGAGTVLAFGFAIVASSWLIKKTVG